MEGHRLVGKRVEAQARELVVTVDLELVDRVVLELRERLAYGVHHEKCKHVGPKHGKHLVCRDGRGLHAVHDEAHHVGVRKGEKRNVAHRAHDGEHEGAHLLARDSPEVVQRATDGRAVVLVSWSSSQNNPPQVPSPQAARV